MLALAGLIVAYWTTPLPFHYHLATSGRRVITGPLFFLAALAPLDGPRGPRTAPLPCGPVTAVLFTCAGQRVDIVTAFARAGATTIATDVDQLAPALYHADRRALVPRVDDPGYIDALRDLVALHDVRLIVPLTDLDHLQLAQARDELGGAVVLVPGAETIARCADKYLAHGFFDDQGIGSPPTWLPGEPAGGAPLPGAREGAPRLRLAAHLPRGRTRRARLLPRLHDRRLDGAGASAAARSSRSTSSATSTAAAWRRSRER